MSEAKCKGGDCGVATYDQTAEHDAYYKAGADTWRSDTPLFCSLECPRREALERALKGKPAESHAAPVERALAAGWNRGRGDYVSCFGGVGSFACGTGKRVIDNKGNHYCDAHGDERGAFATPAPTVTVIDECVDLTDGQYRDMADAFRYAMPKVVLSSAGLTWFGMDAAHPALKPAPRCKRFDCDRTDDRIAMRFSTKGSAAEPVCQKCHLETERLIAHAEEAYRATREPADDRPRATVGTSPVVFGLSVGILSRGMRGRR